jgi:hypothetical protein
MSGILPLLASAALWAAIEMRDATRVATFMNACDTCEAGSTTTTGRPSSPPERTGW